MESNGNGKVIRPTPFKMSHNYSVPFTAFLATSVQPPFISSTLQPGGSQLAINYPLLIGYKEHNENIDHSELSIFSFLLYVFFVLIICFICQLLEVEERAKTFCPFERVCPESSSVAKQPRLDVDQAPPNSTCTNPGHSTAFTAFPGRHSDSWVIDMIFSIVLPST